MERPMFSSVSLSYKNINIFIDINKKDVITGLFFTSESDSFWTPYFSILCSVVEELTIHEAKLIGTSIFNDFIKDTNEEKPFFNVAILLLKEAIKVFEGDVSGHQKLTKSLDDELICRCFGTYKGQIVEHCNNNSEASLNSVSEEFLAGAGCSSCQKDIVKIIENQLGSKSNAQTIFINSMPPAQFILKLDECLASFNFMDYKFEIINLDGYHLSLSTNQVINSSVKEKLENHIFETLEVKLTLIVN